MSENKKIKNILSDLRALSLEDLTLRSKNLEEEVFGLQLKQRTGQLKTTADVRAAKRMLARAHTLISEKKALEKN